MLAKRHALTAALTASAVWSCLVVARPQTPVDVPGSLLVNGVMRTYVAHVPAHLRARPPLVLAFHGHGGTGEQHSRLTHLDALSERFGFVVIYPNGIERKWNDGRARDAGADDIAFTNALIASFSKRYSIDPKRIYATGFSNGGTFSEYLGCRLADRIAAIAPVSGSLPAADVQSCRPSRPLPVLTIAGTADPIMPYGGGEIRVAGADRGEVISAQKTAAFWAENAHCAPVPQTIALPRVTPADGTTVQRSAYKNCAAGTGVEFYTVEGGGHAWPGGPQYLPRMFIGTASNQLDASARIIAFFLAHPMPAVTSKYPQFSRGAEIDTYFGHSVPNPYAELERTQAPDTRRWVGAQTRLTTAAIAALPDDTSLRALVRRIMTTPHDDMPQAGARASVWQRTRRDHYAVLMVRDSRGVRILLDPRARWPNPKTSLAAWQLSPNGDDLAFATETSGSGMVQWRVLDVRSGKEFPNLVQGVPDWAPIAWAHDSSGFYYGGYPSTSSRPAGMPIGQGYAVRFHGLGRAQSSDRDVYSLPNHPSWLPYVRESTDGRYLILGAINGAGGDGNTIAVRDLTSARAAASLIRPMSASTWTYVENSGATAYFSTNDHAPYGRLVAIDLRNPRVERTVIPQTGATLEDVTAVDGELLARYLRDAHSELRVFDYAGRKLGDIALPGIGSATVSGQAASPIAYYRFSSPTMPPTIYSYDARTGRSREVQRETAPFDSARYVTDELFASSTQGARIPIFVAHRRGIPMNGTTPTIITGYGGFGDSYHPVWQTISAAWLAKGGAFAIACVRGGGEYGETWHRAGMLGNKQNAFDDFAAAARAVIHRGYASSRTLAAYGYSGGGLLVGVTEIQHPGLFKAVAEEAGPVDVLRGYTYGSEAVWSSEVGSPIASPAQFAWLYHYAPLLHIRSGTAYPATLVMTSANDARVSPAHAYKFAATLQWAQASSAPILLYVANDAGHISGSLSSQADTIADTIAFLWRETSAATSLVDDFVHR